MEDLRNAPYQDISRPAFPGAEVIGTDTTCCRLTDENDGASEWNAFLTVWGSRAQFERVVTWYKEQGFVGRPWEEGAWRGTLHNGTLKRWRGVVVRRPDPAEEGFATIFTVEARRPPSDCPDWSCWNE